MRKLIPFLFLFALFLCGCADQAKKDPRNAENHVYLISDGKVVAHYVINEKVSDYDFNAFIKFKTKDGTEVKWTGDYLESAQPLPEK